MENEDMIEWHGAEVHTYDSGVVYRLVVIGGSGYSHILGLLDCALGCVGPCQSKEDRF